MYIYICIWCTRASHSPRRRPAAHRQKGWALESAPPGGWCARARASDAALMGHNSLSYNWGRGGIFVFEWIGLMLRARGRGWWWWFRRLAFEWQFEIRTPGAVKFLSNVGGGGGAEDWRGNFEEPCSAVWFGRYSIWIDNVSRVRRNDDGHGVYGNSLLLFASVGVVYRLTLRLKLDKITFCVFRRSKHWKF